MKTLKGTSVYLRAIEPKDLDFLFEIENDEDLWEVSGTQTPYSKFVLKQYLEQAHLDIYQAKQLRLVIAKIDSNLPIGLIDLFDFDPQHKRVGMGIVITAENQGQGFAKESIELLVNYCFNLLQMHQIYCNILEDNTKSRTLFKQLGFVEIGLKKDWNFYKNNFKNEILLQRINK